MTIQKITELDIRCVPKNTITRYWLHLIDDGVGLPIYVPVIVARGGHSKKVIGLTAAVHGNELNGIPLVQGLFKNIDIQRLDGIVVGVPVVNIPSLIRKKRRFIDGVDLNHIMPGDPNGNMSQVYASRIVDGIISQFDYLVDIHTASNGRVNSYYVRTDLDDPEAKKMAELQNPDIILHNPPHDGTLRGAAESLNIPAITVELGDPNLFQREKVRDGLSGIMNLLEQFGFYDVVHEIEEAIEPVICKKSYWMYADTGGFLTVKPQLTEHVTKGQVVALMKNMFGDVIREYRSPESGIVIGKSVQPINYTGGRILHLGILG